MYGQNNNQFKQFRSRMIKSNVQGRQIPYICHTVDARTSCCSTNDSAGSTAWVAKTTPPFPLAKENHLANNTRDLSTQYFQQICTEVRIQHDDKHARISLGQKKKPSCRFVRSPMSFLFRRHKYGKWLMVIMADDSWNTSSSVWWERECEQDQ